MTARIEKTVFISYRHTNYWTALAVFQNLNANGYDVFLDYKSIPSGDFEQVITENIKSRAHFIVILSPSALERCKEPGDWLRREIETAIDNKRNIIPLMMDGFDFGSLATVNALTGKLIDLKKYNAMGIPVEYFDEAMTKLRGDRFLNRRLESVLQPVSNKTKQITEEQISAANDVAPVEIEELTAQKWYERGFVLQNNEEIDDALHCYAEAIHLNPRFAAAYLGHGFMLEKKGDLRGAINEYNQAIQLESNIYQLAMYYSFRGIAHHKKGEFDLAIADYNKTIELDSAYLNIYIYRASAYSDTGDKDAALADYSKAIQLNPKDPAVYELRGDEYFLEGNIDAAITDYNEAIQLIPDDTDIIYHRATAFFKNGNMDAAKTDIDEIIRRKPDVAITYHRRALIFEEKENYISAIADYQKYLDLGGGIQEDNREEVESIIRDLKKKIE